MNELDSYRFNRDERDLLTKLKLKICSDLNETILKMNHSLEIKAMDFQISESQKHRLEDDFCVAIAHFCEKFELRYANSWRRKINLDEKKELE
jgi:hypothetical protein